MEKENSYLCEELAHFISDITFEEIPEYVVEKAKMCILDTLGTALLGSQTEAARKLNKVIQSLGLPNECTVIGACYKTSRLYAAYVNSMEAAYLDFDDGHRESGIHPGCIIIPTALTLGEYLNASGEQILESVILGYEVAIRVGVATGMAQFKRRIDAPSTCGVFGAATAAGKLLGLNEHELANALAIAGSQTPLSPSIWYYEPSMVKSLPHALASKVGILSAMLAKEGFLGPLGILEGRGGFCEATCLPEKYQLEKITEELGRKWRIMEVYFKFYPSCRWCHSAVDATFNILHTQRIKPDDIVEITVKTYPTAAQLSLNEPKDDTTARLSIPYNVVAAIVYGELGVDQFNIDAINNPIVLQLARKVSVVADESFKDKYPSARPTTVEIKLKNGSKYSSHVDFPYGEPENPPSAEQVRYKFVKWVGKYLSQEKIQKIIENVENLDKLKNIKQLIDLLYI
ncbi:MAG: MmgE/PrpD family protein [archaeon YNP-LCB-003-016]|uniref:MmgE/PrpD family protein n=1 Tax=Candidatus Culexarchaeum yellowstonense TaxID=2928963 RepID=UPI0026F31EC8|nr:MmgE/PrpD family protein [Candidatus Culexarchaeum yellowstonense]MCR6691770.1 MmgE/PrpD family protein [Candidatus Culexarchaeum yellowstonense]